MRSPGKSKKGQKRNVLRKKKKYSIRGGKETRRENELFGVETTKNHPTRRELDCFGNRLKAGVNSKSPRPPKKDTSLAKNGTSRYQEYGVYFAGVPGHLPQKKRKDKNYTLLYESSNLREALKEKRHCHWGGQADQSKVWTKKGSS